MARARGMGEDNRGEMEASEMGRELRGRDGGAKTLFSFSIGPERWT